MQDKQKRVTTQRVLVVSFLVNVLDVITNGVVAVITGSAVIFTEMLQGAADLAASGFLLVGQNEAKKPPGTLHPFGRGKEVFFWSLIGTLMLFTFTSLGSIWRGYNQFVNPEPLRSVYLGLIVTAIGIFSNSYALILSFRKLARKGVAFTHAFRQSARSAVKTSLISDLAGVLAAVVGFVALIMYSTTGNLIFDAVGAITVGVILAVMSLLLIWEIKGYIVGRAAPKEVEDKIVEITERVDGVVDVVDLRTMHIGPQELLINIEVNIKDGLVTDEVEKTIDDIRESLRLEMPEAVHIQIEAESPDIAVESDENIMVKGGHNAETKKN